MTDDVMSRPLLEIAEALAGDLPAVAELAALTLREPWSAESFAESRAQPGATLLVVHAGRARGARLMGFLLAQRVLDELHVLALATHPAARRHGVATALLDAAVLGARDRAALDEPAADLGIVAAIASSFRNLQIPADIAANGTNARMWSNRVRR